MQLFLNNFIDNGDIIINDQDLIRQIRKVLRLKIGSIFRLQKTIEDTYQSEVIRIQVKINKRDDKHIYTHKLQEEKRKIRDIKNHTSMLIAMPNKWQKAELITQKLSEIGIQNIYFWPSERSIIKEKNINKRSRLEKISKEAIEQSRGWIAPHIQFVDNIHLFLEQQQHADLVVFDLDTKSDDSLESISTEKNRIGVVGPEGGFTNKDYQNLQQYHTPLYFKLGETVLRMETASIIASWILYNK